MADPMDVLTLEEAKQALNIGASVTKHDAELPTYITAVTQRLDLLIGPVVQRPVTDETQDGGSWSVFCDYYPVTSITSVTEYDETTPTVLTRETPLSAPDDGYLVEPYHPIRALLSGRIRRRREGKNVRFAKGDRNIVVSYVAGRTSDTALVPERYKLAAKLMLANFWRSQQDATGGVNEFDLPQSNFPRFAVPLAARQMMQGEVQEPRQLVL